MIWGALHGLGVLITRELERSAFYRERIPKLPKQVGVFLFVCLTWVFFRAESLGDALYIVRRIFTSALSDPQIPALMVGIVLLVWVYEFLYESRFRPVLAHGAVRIATAAFMVIYLCLCSSGGGAFIYFQF